MPAPPLRFALIGFTIIAVLSPHVAGQQSSDTFDVVSVKPNAAADGRGGMGPQGGGRFVMVNGTATSLINFAYSLTSDGAIVGLPDWVRAARFDVNARASETNVSLDRIRLMVRSLLADRFRLVAHPDTQEQPTYALVLARSDRRLGPNLRPATVNCNELNAQIAAGKAPRLTPPAATGPVAPCVMRSRMGTFHSGATTMALLSISLVPSVQRVIIDKTGLEGYYQVELDFAPLPSSADPEPSQLPSLFTAVEEQLGLKLVSERNLVPVLVIDRIERPAAD